MKKKDPEQKNKIIKAKNNLVEMILLTRFWRSIILLNDAILFGAFILYPYPAITAIIIATEKYKLTKPKLSTSILWYNIGVMINVNKIFTNWFNERLKKFLKKIDLIIFFIKKKLKFFE